MGQRTPLYDLHLALGAKMVDFWRLGICLCTMARKLKNTIRCDATAGCSMYLI